MARAIQWVEPGVEQHLTGFKQFIELDRPNLNVRLIDVSFDGGALSKLGKGASVKKPEPKKCANNERSNSNPGITPGPTMAASFSPVAD